jgi:hypothetical protein
MIGCGTGLTSEGRFADVVTCVMTMNELKDIEPLADFVWKVAKNDST